jgi:hypothetical protein
VVIKFKKHLPKKPGKSDKNYKRLVNGNKGLATSIDTGMVLLKMPKIF